MEVKGRWIIDLESELKAINPSEELKICKTRCIYRVPKILRDLNREAYTPQLVSFGPYHHDRDHLKLMEPHKRRALLNFLMRANKELGEVVETTRPKLKELMESYDGLEEWWRRDVDRFLMMMILDGCFLLDIMIWHTVDFRRPYMTKRLFVDMLMLENQLPLSLLSILVEMGGDKAEDAIKFIKYYVNISEQDIRDRQEENIEGLGVHHLDLYRRRMAMSREYCFDAYWNIPSATQLFQAGVHFNTSRTNYLTDINFRDGVLTLPFLKVDDNTEPMFLNMLAFEQIHDVSKGVTSYAFCMDNLINTAKDVALLKDKGILEGWMGSDDDIAGLFNRLTNAIVFFTWSGSVNVNKELRQYCNRRWPRWRASFIQTYLSTPWVFISLVGAALLLTLTVAQTVYSVLSYYK